MSEFLDFARRLMALRQKETQTIAPSVILGSMAELPQSLQHRAPYRVGLWPCTSATDPQLALACFTALGYLLEQWRDIEVYRLFAPYKEGEEVFEWEVSQSQFTPDDWAVEALDENIAVWGTLESKAGQLHLTVFIENDLKPDLDVSTFEFVATHATDLILLLPQVAKQLAEAIEAERLDETDMIYTSAQVDAELFVTLNRWEVYLNASLWGYIREDTEWETDYHKLVEFLKQSNATDFAPWVLGKLFGQTLLPGYRDVARLIYPLLAKDKVIASHLHQAFVPTLARAFYFYGEVESAFALLKKHIESQPNNVYAYLRLAELYTLSTYLYEAIQCFQSAISANATNTALYRSYGNLLLAVSQQGIELRTFALAQHHSDDQTIWESIIAYQHALALNPDDIRSLYSQLLQLLYVDADLSEFWDGFKKLVEKDEQGGYIRDLVDSLYDVEDITPGISILQGALAKQERLDLLINTACLYMAHDETEEARPYLEKAKTLASELEDLADVERLFINLDDPEFEHRFGDIKGLIEAGSSPNAEDVEFLEEVAEVAPHLVEAQVLLAKAYERWDDRDAALEVLLDAHEKLPVNVDVIDLLAKILWDSGEEKVAFQYLNQGIKVFPNAVELLARAGRYLFDSEQFAEAKAFLNRAEEIAPKDPVLKSTRAYIASKIAQNPEQYRDL